jgi:glycosyltransferase involved in cell wall biosynthesis
VTLLVPALNEIKGMKEVMPRIPKDCYDQLLVVDGGSTDGTIEYAKQSGYEVIHQKKKGMRRAYAEALPYVTGDVVITFSPDGNSVPELIPKLVETAQEGYDMIIVSRYLSGAKSYDDNSFTGFANKVFTFTTNALFGSRYTDAMVIYRAYNKRLINFLGLNDESNVTYYVPEKIFGKIMSWELLLSVRSAKRKLRVIEIPGDEPLRVDGHMKVHYRWGLAYVLQLIMEAFVWK